MTATCPICESNSVHSNVEVETFQYGQGPSLALLQANVRVYECESCGFRYTDGEAEDARHAAVCHHLGVSSPAELIQSRSDLGLTQEQLATLTAIGVASLSRWESGSKIQNKANDNLLYLVRFSENRTRLEQRKFAIESGGGSNVISIDKARRFRSIQNFDLAAKRAGHFRVRTN